MFPGTGNPKKVLPSQLVPKKWVNDSGVSRKEAEQAHECKSEKLSAEESIEGAVKLISLLTSTSSRILTCEPPIEEYKPAYQFAVFAVKRVSEIKCRHTAKSRGCVLGFNCLFLCNPFIQDLTLEDWSYTPESKRNC